MAKMNPKAQDHKHKRRFRPPSRKSCLILVLVLAGLCILAIGASAWSNRDLPIQRNAPSEIDPLDKVRLLEAVRLRTNLGEGVWPGFGDQPIPVILHYGQVSFLTGYPGTPPSAWEPVPGDGLQGTTYYRMPERDPQNFALQVGDVWAAGIATKTMTDMFLIQTFQAFLPPILEPLFPYRLLLQPSETQIGAVMHESFHVLQAHSAPQRLETAEAAHKQGESYWSADLEMRSNWGKEVDLLLKALSAGTEAEAQDLTRQWLKARQARRQEAGLSPELVDYERWLEWEEGLAKYAEIKALQLAYESGGYQPVAGMETDPDFKAYQGYPNRWQQENIQLRLSSRQEGETRFYQTGLAQAYLLDRLAEDWKINVMEEGVFLEDMLQETVR